ncbi:glycosyltransferase [Rhodobacteraceae bacterium CCMM004]|nr:glycosyltransferase [Rhodobacteraceae bacterium CCMM004]
MPDEPLSQHLPRFPERIAYVVSHSLPYSSNGYATRTHEIAKALAGHGHDVIVFNRPGRPWSIDGFPSDTEVAVDQKYDGVRYVFLPTTLPTGIALRDELRLAERMLMEAFEVFRPALVLAASDWKTAEPAQYAARRFGVPFFYEQRGFWEMSMATRDADFAGSDDYTRHQAQEASVAGGADAVFTLTREMQGTLVGRGVAPGRIHLVPNGTGRPLALRGGPSRQGLELKARYILGYIGSLSDYEGVDDLIRVTAHLHRQGTDVAALIVGSSAPSGIVGSQHDKTAETGLAALAEELGIADRVRFFDQVPGDRVGPYYVMADAIVLPRRRTAVTELVAPLKPYAAAAYGKPVFLPDMPPLDDIAREIGGHLFPQGDIPALAERIVEVLTDPELSAPPLPGPDLDWPARVRPMVRLFKSVAAAERARQPRADLVTSTGEAPPVRFDLTSLPLGHAATGVAAVGPCRGQAAERDITHLDRQTLLRHLATAPPGRFVVDWPGLKQAPGDWTGLWSIHDMRLNRQMMDACRIALDRGWTLQVIAPVPRAEAPLFRTVAGVFNEIPPAADTDAPRQEGAA